MSINGDELGHSERIQCWNKPKWADIGQNGSDLSDLEEERWCGLGWKEADERSCDKAGKSTGRRHSFSRYPFV